MMSTAICLTASVLARYAYTRVPSRQKIMKPVKMCPNGGVGWCGSMRHGVQLKTKMNIDDSNEEQIRPQRRIFLSSRIALSALPNVEPPCASLCPKFSDHWLETYIMQSTRHTLARSNGVT